jgi:hypothetical protein
MSGFGVASNSIRRWATRHTALVSIGVAKAGTVAMLMVLRLIMLPTRVVGVNLRPNLARGRPQEKTLQKAHLAAVTYAQILCCGAPANARRKNHPPRRRIGRTSSKTVDFIGFWCLPFLRAIQTNP